MITTEFFRIGYLLHIIWHSTGSRPIVLVHFYTPSRRIEIHNNIIYNSYLHNTCAHVVWWEYNTVETAGWVEQNAVFPRREAKSWIYIARGNYTDNSELFQRSLARSISKNAANRYTAVYYFYSQITFLLPITKPLDPLFLFSISAVFTRTCALFLSIDIVVAIPNTLQSGQRSTKLLEQTTFWHDDYYSCLPFKSFVISEPASDMQ